MKFVSTQQQEGVPPRYYSFQEALISGWASNGGMLLPVDVPKLDMQRCKTLSYPELCYEVLALFSEGEIPSKDLREICNRSFVDFSRQNVVEIKNVQNNIFVCELWHGPTLAFKDLGLQVLAELICYFLKKEDKRLNMLIGTSGDTGGSALAAFKGKKNVDVICLYPQGRVSKVQENQMLSYTKESNCYVVAVDGTSDDLDVPIENVFNNLEFKELHCCSSVNSVNIGRILVQIVHYFWSYFRIGNSKTVQFSVPTGAGGHLTAGMLAQLMGLPMDSLIVATNSNDIMHQFLSTGTAEVAQSCLATYSNAMDIQVPYNIERILNLASGRNGELTKTHMRSFKSGPKALKIDSTLLTALKEDFHIKSVAVSDDKIQKCMKSIWDSEKYVLDPHTAVGLYAAQELGLESTPTICMGCAHPAKFIETVSECLEIPILAAVDVCSDKNHKNVSTVTELFLSDTPTDCISFNKSENWVEKLMNLIENVTEKYYKKSS
mmetsp:Transcript_15184/g.17195  ORF Transcript_15184/g.17195 Transcript_15184/m.17195 type:complete len:492 (-) Transcript_15184:908-2383(-)|eukprot:CAMPEP_0184022536 /NCGR_PEP_ID=MMETSP0954-20121128/10683_1 /TAXON_ID=627963 /ORGANISM="Aplanochytrium sp, Strain PBS07" /LENGTH=491 /DNA_ID=CAMNT_0026304967 /DNA_START=173 /DNA_END=1648 /DNA_ORIENTATION=-